MSFLNITFQKIIMLNPMAQSIQAARYVMVTNQTIIGKNLYNGGLFQYIHFLIVIVVFIFGVIYFKKSSKFFAENI